MGLPTEKGMFFAGHAFTEHTTLHLPRGWGSHRTRPGDNACGGDPPQQDAEGNIGHAGCSSAPVPCLLFSKVKFGSRADALALLLREDVKVEASVGDGVGLNSRHSGDLMRGLNPNPWNTCSLNRR
jgi:hypothetical protein